MEPARALLQRGRFLPGNAPLGEPTTGTDSFEIRWRGIYRKAGLPELAFEGTERVVFEGDRIKLMQDLMEADADRRIQDYVARYLD